MPIIEEYMPEIAREDTKRFKVTIKDENEELVDPDLVHLTFIKDGAAESPMGPYVCSRLSEGIYYLFKAMPKDCTLGDWVRQWDWWIGSAPGRYQSLLRIVDLTEMVNTFD